MGRADMCQTGKYRERGIKGLDGFQTEFVVDKQRCIIRVPATLESVGVLMEALSNCRESHRRSASRADRALSGSRRDSGLAFWTPVLSGRIRVGGTVGGMVLRLRGEVYGLDVVDPASARPAKPAACRYIIRSGIFHRTREIQCMMSRLPPPSSPES